jgi:hypothetical protein
MDALGRTRQMIEASKEVGTATIEELRRQKVVFLVSQLLIYFTFYKF